MNFYKTDRILNIHHNDLDGAVSCIVLKNSFYHVEEIDCQFGDVDRLMKRVDYKKFDWVFLTDIHPEDPNSLNLSDNIVLLDHHDSAKDLHNPEKFRWVISTVCGAKLTKRFCEKVFPDLDLSHLNNLVTLTNDYDLWTHNIKKSRFLNEVFTKYFSTKFIERFKDGSTRFTDDEILYLRSRRKEFIKVCNNLDVTDLEKINGCIVVNQYFLNDVCERLMKEAGYRIVFSVNPKNSHTSIRHNIPNLHIGDLLKELQIGGGHKDAGAITEDSLVNLKTKVELIESMLFELYPEIHK